MGKVTSFTVPHYIESQSREGLHSLMKETNQLLDSFVNYRFIGQDLDGTWYAWFDFDYIDLTARQENEESKTS